MIEPLLKDIEKCVKCGGCKTVCPTFNYGLMEPLSARGRMMMLRDLYKGGISPGKLFRDRIWSCLLCGLCESSCPAGVPVTSAIYRARKRLRHRDIERLPYRLIARHILAHPSRIGFALNVFKHLSPWLRRKGIVPFDLQVVDTAIDRGTQVMKPKKKKGRVAIFTGCAVNFLMPHLGDALIRVLYGMGYEVVLPAGEVCCGAPHRALGMENTARKLAKRNMDVFSRLKADAVLSLCPTCTLTIKNNYAEMYERGGIPRAMDAIEFLSDKIKLPDNPPPGGTVFYHPPCHLAAGLGVKEQPLNVLRQLNYTAITPSEPGCCGFSLSLTHREMSEGILLTRADEYKQTDTLVTACPGCILQLERIHPDVRHLIEIIDEGITGPLLF